MSGPLPAFTDERAARDRIEQLQVEIPALERELASVAAGIGPARRAAAAAEARHQSLLDSLWKIRMVNARLAGRIERRALAGRLSVSVPFLVVIGVILLLRVLLN